MGWYCFIKRLTIFFGLAFLLIFQTSCQKKTESQSVRFVLPDIQSYKQNKMSHSISDNKEYSTVYIEKISINVTGPGISRPIVFIWDNNHKGSLKVPEVISLEVPRGEKRLFQLLVIVEGSEQEFLYGDTVQDIMADYESVYLKLNDLFAVEVEGAISGRYLTTENMGPTGEFDYIVIPSEERPGMVAHRGEIVAGWFSFYSLPGLQFSYRMADGTSIFHRVRTTDTKILSSQPYQRTARIRIPQHYEYDGSGGIEKVLEEFQVFGFWGPGVMSEHRICYTNDDYILAGRFKDKDLSQPLKWVGAETTTNIRVDFVDLGDGPIPGGNAEASCTANGEFARYLEIHPYFLGGGRNSRSLGFEGGFRYIGDQEINPNKDINLFLKVEAEGHSDLKVHWQLLPGVSQVIDSVSVYHRERDTEIVDGDSSITGGYLQDGDRTPCDELSEKGFVRYSVSKTQGSVKIANGKMEDDIVVCLKRPTEKSQYLQRGLVHHYSHWHDEGELSLALTGPDQFRSGSCQPYTVKLQSDGQDIEFKETMELELIANSEHVEFYHDSIYEGSFAIAGSSFCGETDSPVGVITAWSGTDELIIYVRNPKAEPFDIEVKGPGEVLPVSASINTGPKEFYLHPNNPDITCVEFSIKARDAMGGHVDFLLNEENLTISSSETLGLFSSNADCIDGESTIELHLSSGPFGGQNFYYKKGQDSEKTINISVDSNPNEPAGDPMTGESYTFPSDEGPS